MRSIKGVINDIKKPGQDEVGYDRIPTRALPSLNRLLKTAVADLSAYLEHVPHAGDRFAITERLIELGHGDPSRLH